MKKLPKKQLKFYGVTVVKRRIFKNEKFAIIAANFLVLNAKFQKKLDAYFKMFKGITFSKAANLCTCVLIALCPLWSLWLKIEWKAGIASIVNSKKNAVLSANFWVLNAKLLDKITAYFKKRKGITFSKASPLCTCVLFACVLCG